MSIFLKMQGGGGTRMESDGGRYTEAVALLAF